jgi:IMP dehydrogenase
MRELLTFDDVLIVPKFSHLESRSQVNLSTNIRALQFSLPVISANMDTVTGPRLAQAMIQNGAQACLHRFGTIDQTIQDFLATKGYENKDPAMVSIGLGPMELERAKALFDVGAHTFVIDVAHGAQISVVKQVKALRELLGRHVNLVVGNFASGASVETFIHYVGMDVDAFKVGIGPGSACTTRIKTGVGYPQLSAIMDITRTLIQTGIPVIADGGIKKPGDIAKAIGAGASMVMLGGMLAGTEETPGELVMKGEGGDWNVSKWKKYRGSASLESYQAQGKEAKHRAAEGESFLVPYKGTVADVLQDIEGGLRSAMTYVGARNLDEFKRQCEFVRVSSSTIAENGAHGKR